MLIEKNTTRFPIWPVGGCGIASGAILMTGRNADSDIPYHFELRFDPDNPPGDRARMIHAYCTAQDWYHEAESTTVIGELPNPINFRWIDLLDWFGLAQNGRTQKRLTKALDALLAIRIITRQAIFSRSEGLLDGELRLYERFVAKGEPDAMGEVSNSNRLYQAPWYHDSLNSRHYVRVDTKLWGSIHYTDPIASRLFEILAGKADRDDIRVLNSTLARLLCLPTDRMICNSMGPIKKAADLLANKGVLAKWKLRGDLYTFHRGEMLFRRESYKLRDDLMFSL